MGYGSNQTKIKNYLSKNTGHFSHILHVASSDERQKHVNISANSLIKYANSRDGNLYSDSIHQFERYI